MARPGREQGIALIAVLWLIALLTLLATTLVTLSVTHRRMTEGYAQAIQADSTTDSAIRVVLLRLIAPEDRKPALQPGQMQPLVIFDSNADVSLERESGRIDLNTADPDLLFALFAANGWKEADARSMVARITDWKDTDDVTEEGGGAEAGEYRAANLAYGPRNAPFESVDELRQVLGAEHINDELFDSLTAFTHLTGCLESAAIPAVKRALSWADERQLGGHHWLQETSAGTGAASAISPYPTLTGDVVRLRACMRLQDGSATRCRVAVVRVTGNERNPLQVFEWRATRPLSQPQIEMP